MLAHSPELVKALQKVATVAQLMLLEPLQGGPHGEGREARVPASSSGACALGVMVLLVCLHPGW